MADNTGRCSRRLIVFVIKSLLNLSDPAELILNAAPLDADQIVVQLLGQFADLVVVDH